MEGDASLHSGMRLGHLLHRSMLYPPLSSKRLRVTVPSHPQGNLPQVTVPSPPGLLDKRRATQNKRANTRACEPQSDQETACRDACQVY